MEIKLSPQELSQLLMALGQGMGALSAIVTMRPNGINLNGAADVLIKINEAAEMLQGKVGDESN